MGKKLKSAIKTEISQFDEDGENVDLLVLKIELTRKAIDMCEKFKRKMLQHYLIYLLRSFKEDLKRITVQSNSMNNNNTPADQDRNNKDSEAKISRSNTKKRSS